jgi:hypothetical protein
MLLGCNQEDAAGQAVHDSDETLCRFGPGGG